MSAIRNGDAIFQRLHSGEKALRRYRFRVGGVALVSGALLSSLYIGIKLHKGFKEDPWTNHSIHEHVFSFASAFAYCSGYFILNLAPLADDIRLMRCILLCDIAMLLADAYLALTVYDAFPPNYPLSPCKPATWLKLQQMYTLLVDVLCIIGALVAMRRDSVLQMRDFFLRILITYFALDLPANIFYGVMYSYGCQVFSWEWYWVLCEISFLVLTLKPHIQQTLQARLGQMLDMYSARKSAASIAAFLGDCRVVEVLSSAEACFRSVSLDRVAYEDVADNAPNPALTVHTEFTKMGMCDAFISHSWHDQPEAKWTALQDWRHEFLLQHGREPRVWFDKFCIDQNDIDTSLRCLPIHLSGCRNLVILLGKTYLSRLWCIIEIFVYIHMGGDIKNIFVLPVTVSAAPQPDYPTPLRRSFSSNSEVAATIDDFDARGCDCFRATDKQKLQTIILVAFGSMDSFNACVRQTLGGIFRGTRERPELSSDESSEESSEESSDNCVGSP